MNKKKGLNFFLISLLCILIIFVSVKILIKEKPKEAIIDNSEADSYSSNIISDVSFASTDITGRSYTVKALEGEVDFDNNKIIYLKKIIATVNIDNTDDIMITADFGKYDTENFNTIFSDNVKIEYTDIKIIADYVDFSLQNNLITISRNVNFFGLNSSLKADVIEVNITSKDAKIYMYEDYKKVKMNIKN
jgi:hypothetical protein|tara:strand:+ start:150 stop:722 length:573 start_codon:yes stop_codon:yes gene_type:complete